MTTLWNYETESAPVTWTQESRNYPSVYGIGRYGLTIYGSDIAGTGAYTFETVHSGDTIYVVTDTGAFLITETGAFIVTNDGAGWINEQKTS